MEDEIKVNQDNDFTDEEVNQNFETQREEEIQPTVEEDIAVEETVENQPIEEDNIVEETVENQPIEEDIAVEETVENQPIEEDNIVEETVENQPIEEDNIVEETVENQPVEEDATSEIIEDDNAVEETQEIKKPLPVFEEETDDDFDDDANTEIANENPNQYRDEDGVSQFFEEVSEDEIPKKKKKKKRRRKTQLDPTVQPVKAGKLFLAEILISIPIIGIIFALIFSFNKKVNKNVRTYAKLSLIWHALGLAVFIFFASTGGLGYVIDWLFNLFGIKAIIF